MPVQLKVSNSIKSLSEELARELKNNTSVFRPVYIVTQTEGMNNWLKMQLAEKLGIAANIRFIKPNDLIHKIYNILGGKYSQSVASHDLNWLLFKALDENDFKRRWPDIAAYYQDTFVNSDKKRMAMAEKMADLFDQYQIYRTDVIENWNENKTEDSWQKDLWLRTREMAGEHFPDKTMVGKYILEMLENPENGERLNKSLPVIYFFGLSLITTYHLKLINKIGEFSGVQFLIQNPAPEDYWFDEKPERVINYMIQKGWRDPKEESLANPLLVSWGKLIQDTFLLLFQDEDTLNLYTEIDLKMPGDDSLLTAIQYAIYNNQKNDLDFTDKLHDNSITINSCFNPVRELEVLYNYLVGLIDLRNEELSARDIVVMVSDIDKYASYIRAVFDNAPYKFKYTIADESFVSEDGVLSALMALLSMNEQQFTSEKVVSLLDYSVLRKNFKIEDTLKVREWVNAANIRFGIKGERAEESDFVSWDYGLKRMMFGLCMSGAEEYGEGENSFYPLDLIEGFETEMASRFVYFVNSLTDSVKSRKRKRNIGEWINYVEETLQRFIGERAEVEEEDYNELLNQLEKYNLLQELYTEEVSYEVFLYNFLPTLSSASRNRSFANRGITFCSLVPMRSIPFKVVALLGLDFDKFPRKDKRLSFDLMNIEKRKGDRNLKENDKHLFLETLLSAEKYLYISYTGQSVRDNSKLPPSALVDELIDFIAVNTQNPDESRTKLIKNHPLHGFSKKYNTASDKDLYSYLLNNETEEVKLTGTEEAEAFNFDEISIQSIEKFVKEPVKFYYNKVLNIYDNTEELSLAETELFDFNHLQLWSLKNQLLEVDDEEIEDFRLKSVKLGKLPLKNKGLALIEKTNEEIAFVKNELFRLTNEEQEETADINLKIGNSLITGKIGGIYNQNLICYSFSKYENKYLFFAYLRFLLLTASDIAVEVKFISSTKGKLLHYPKISKAEAVEELSKIVDLYIKGHQEMQSFDYAFGVSEKTIENQNFNEYLSKINDYFGDYKGKGNAFQRKEYRNGFYKKEKSFEIFIEMAKIVLLPLAEFR